MELIDVLRRSLRGSGKKTTNDYYSYFCPFCNHYKEKLAVNVHTQHWHCWACKTRGSSVYSLMIQINAPDEIKSAAKRFAKVKDNVHVEHVQTIQYPEHYKIDNSSSQLVDRKVNGYIFNVRKLTEHDVKKYNISYSLDGYYKNMLIFPSYDAFNNINFLTGRAFVDSAQDFLLPKNISRDFIGFENFIDWNQEITIVEGALDAITIRRNAIPLYGKTISKKLKIKLIEKNVPRINICLDADAFSDSIDIIEYLLSYGKHVYFVELNGDEDPNKLGYTEIWNRIKNARQLTESDIFKIKIQLKINK